MDEIDKKIIKILQKNGREQFNEIAQKVGLSNAAVHARVIKLERAGIISGYFVYINPTAVGKELDAFIKITVDHSKDSPEKTFDALLNVPAVTDVYAHTGEWDYTVRVLVKNVNELRKVTTRIIKDAVPHMIRSDTSIILLSKRKPLEL